MTTWHDSSQWDKVDAKTVEDGDSLTVYVSIVDPRESALILVHVFAQRLDARKQRNFIEADALHRQIIDSGHRLVCSFPIHYIYAFNPRYFPSNCLLI